MNSSIKHRWLARTIKAFLQLSFGFLIITFTINLLAEVFHFKKYISHKNWIFGDPQVGYMLKAGFQVSIPDTSITYIDGQRNIFSQFPGRERLQSNDEKRVKTAVVVNKFATFDNKDILISNTITIRNPVNIYVNSLNPKHRVFWSFYTQLDLLFSIFFFLLLIKLLIKYINGRIFEPQTFKLIAGFGWLLIGKDAVSFIMAYINGKIIGGFYFSSTNTMTNKRYDAIDLSLNFYNGFSLLNIGVGLLILLLAYVIKEAILAKNENDLTV